MTHIERTWSLMWEYWSAGGPLLIPMFFLCTGIWYYLHLLGGRLNLQIRMSARDQDRFFDYIQQSQGGIPFLATTATKSWLSNGLRESLCFAGEGQKALDHFNQFKNHVEKTMRRDLMILAALTAISPLVGLLGTVFGMIECFDFVSSAGHSGIDDISRGIAQALITTQFGLVIAIPGVLGLVWLRKRLRMLLNQYGQASIKLQLYIHEKATSS